MKPNELFRKSEHVLRLLTREHSLLSSRFVLENISFRLISICWLVLTLILIPESPNLLIPIAIIAYITAAIWKGSATRVLKSRRQLEEALVEEANATDDGGIKKIYVEWLHENSDSWLKPLSSAEPYIWALLTMITVLLRWQFAL